MIEKWLTEDIQKTFDRGYKRFVICDPNGEAGYLRDHLPKSWKVEEAHNDLEELEAKYHAEKEGSDTPVVFYTQVPLEKLTYLMEYAMIDGHLDLVEFHQYIKKKVHDKVGLNLNLGKKELLNAAKVSRGKGKTYWMDIGNKGGGEIFDLKTMLPEFLHAPKAYVADMDGELRKAFLSKVQEHIGQQPLKKPATTVAKETADYLLKGLLNNNIDETLFHIYHQWIDSATYQDSLKKHIDQFKIPAGTDIWALHPDHPFAAIDREQIAELAANLADDKFVESKVKALERRARNKCAHLLQIDWWAYMLNLIRFDSSGIKTISSFEEAIRYYRETFYKLDRAIRKLYAQFLSDEKVIQPLQGRYEAILKDLLHKWYEHIGDCAESQTGRLKQLIAEDSGQIAIIVGDGIGYEVALEVSERSSNSLKATEDFLLADIPSITDNNMSRLYLEDGGFSDSKEKRELRLNGEFPDRIIKHIYLDDLNQSHTECEVLICSYKDIDDIAEKMQQKALKYFDTIVTTLTKKIGELAKLGFSSIYLVSDHGFVLSGMLKNADKLEYSPQGKSVKSERFIACKEKQDVPDSLLQVDKKYREYDYLLFSKNLRPFKTTGSYGYAHGGASPQELIVPLFHFRSEEATPQLSIFIENKEELGQVEGQNFQVRLKAEESEGNLFKTDRKCQLKLYTSGKEKSSSDSFTLSAGSKQSREFSFDSDDEVMVYVLDSQTQEQLDKAIIRKAEGRDLGGLI